MKERTKLQRVVDKMKPIINEAKITPEQYRYVSKKLREQLGLQIPKIPKKLPNYLNQAEIWVLLKEAQNDSFSFVLIEFLIFTGLRIAETRNMMIEHIDFDNNQLKVVQGKGKKDRHVAVTPNLQSKLLLYLGKSRKGYLFAKTNGRAYSIRALQKRVTDTVKRCNFTKHITTHSLRHTFACYCRAKGLPLEHIQILLGHSSIKQTEWYGRLELGAIKEDFIRLIDQKG